MILIVSSFKGYLKIELAAQLFFQKLAKTFEKSLSYGRIVRYVIKFKERHQCLYHSKQKKQTTVC